MFQRHIVCTYQELHLKIHYAEQSVNKRLPVVIVAQFYSRIALVQAAGRDLVSNVQAGILSRQG